MEGGGWKSSLKVGDMSPLSFSILNISVLFDDVY